MPSSGARSGTKPSRKGRGAGDGAVMEKMKLACGHWVSQPQVLAVKANGTKLYSCPECGLQKKAWRQT